MNGIILPEGRTMDEHNNKKKQRGIESIAHLFLSQLDKQREGNSDRRTPPADNSSGNELPVQNDITDYSADFNDGAGENTGRSDYDFDLDDSLQGEIVLAYHLRDSFSKVHDYAEYQSQRDERVALVSIDQYEVTLLEVFNGDPFDYPIVIAETEGTAASLIPQINEAANGFDTIILNVDPSFAPRINEIISHADCVTLITDCTNDGIVSSYQVLKSVAADIEGDQEISLFVCDAVNEQYADRAYYKFAETAKKYVDRTIIPAGCSLLKEPEEVVLDDKLPTAKDNSEVSENNDKHTEPVAECDQQRDIAPDSEVTAVNADQSEVKMDIQAEENTESQIDALEFYNPDDLIIQPQNFSSCNTYDTARTDDIIELKQQKVDEEQVETAKDEAGFDSSGKEYCQNSYRPAVSDHDSHENECNPDVKIFKAGQISSIEDLLGVSCDSRKAVISRPQPVCHSGPASVSPVVVNKPLESDFEIADFVGRNLARLSEYKGLVSIELQQFEDVFPYAKVMVDIEGKVHVILSAVYADSVAGSVEMVIQWLSDNIGAIATRYRILKIKAYIPIQVILIAGTNFNSIYDEALIAADEFDAECVVHQLSSFEMNGKHYISLQCG